jgi:hypothetical protein
MRCGSYASGDDGFVVVWVEEFSSIQARRLNASGVPSGAQFEVAEDYPVYFDFGVAGDPTGHFVVAWDSFGADGDDVGIVARRFDSTNALVGGSSSSIPTRRVSSSMRVSHPTRPAIS